MKTRLWIVLGLLSLGCGPSVIDLDDGTGGQTGGTTPMSASGPSADSTTGACEWQMQQPPDAGELPPECIDLVSTDEAAPVTVRIVNDGASVVYLTSAVPCTAFHFEVEDSMGHAFPPSCAWTCEEAMQGACGCLAVCDYPPTVALSPGGVYQTEWFGWLPEMTEVSETCAGDCAGECARLVAPTEGTMTVSVGLADATDCGDACNCTPNAEGWCEIPGAPLDATLVSSTPVTWPPPCPVLEVSVL